MRVLNVNICIAMALHFLAICSCTSFALWEKKQVNQINDLKMDKLTFETEYVMEIHGVNPKQNDWETSTAELTTCWDIPGMDVKTCPPLLLKNIDSFRMHQLNFDEIYVTWDLPKYLPDYYTVTLYLHTDNVSIVSQNVSGSSTSADFSELNITNVKYDVQITSVSSAGQTPNPPIGFEVKAPLLTANPTVQDKCAIWISIFLVVLMIATLIVISHRKIFNKKPKTVCYFQVLDDKMVIQPDDVENVLGQKGTWNSNNDNINVKILQVVSEKKKKSFMYELLKSVGHLENVANIH